MTAHKTFEVPIKTKTLDDLDDTALQTVKTFLQLNKKLDLETFDGTSQEKPLAKTTLLWA